jgi:hypothetical protein
MLESILFNKNQYTGAQARKWLLANNYKSIKTVKTSKNNIRYRINEPKQGYKYRLQNMGNGITFVYQLV